MATNNNGDDGDLEATIGKLASLLRVQEGGASDDDDRHSRGSGSYSGSDSGSYSGSRSYSGSDSGSGSVTGSDSGSDSDASGSSYTGSSRSGPAGGSPSSASRSTRTRGTGASTNRSGVAMPPHPRPFDLWRQAHEVQHDEKPPVVLTNSQWAKLVHRLNDSSRTKHIYLMQAQHKQIADELRGLRFSPQICQRSRDIASRVPTLPQRLSELMRFKKARQDKLRHELAQEEFAEVTFQPKINSRSREMVRNVGNLTRYGEVQRVRRKQRARIMQEVEDRELTFSPQINARSLQILNDAKAAGRGSRPTLAERHRRKLAKQQAVREGRLPEDYSSVYSGTSRAKSLSHVPGHEQESFSPVINKRSRRLKDRGKKGSVFNRLYKQGVQQVLEKTASVERIEAEAAPLVLRERKAKRELARSPMPGVPGGGRNSPRTPASPVKRNDPRYFNTVVYQPAKHAFIARRLQGADEDVEADTVARQMMA